jgi:acetyltransferase
MNLKSFFSPKSIAIVGISSNPHKLGTVIYQNLLNSEYKGEIFFVNPKYSQLYGKDVYSHIKEIEEEIDMVIITIPAKYVSNVVQEAGEKKVKSAIIISAGFKEIGDEGIKLETELKKISEKYGIRILGPNCLGLSVPSHNMNASFAAINPIPGNIAFFSQSGAINTALLDMSVSRNLGFKYFVSLGNKLDINENHILEAWVKDPDISVIGGYLEDFYDGNKFVDIARKSQKPIVLLNVGKNKTTQTAIKSHTGSLASDSVIVQTALIQAGVNIVESIEELFSTLLFFERSRIPSGEKICIVTNAGGPSIMLIDLLTNEGLDLAKIETNIKTKLKMTLPKNASIHNPIDILGDAPAERYRKVLEILKSSKNIDSIIILISPQYVTQIEETVKAISEISIQTDKCIIPILLGDKYMNDAIERLDDRKVVIFKQPTLAIKALKHGVNFEFYSKNTYSLPKINLQIGKFKTYMKDFSNFTPTPLPEMLAKEIAKEVGLFFPKEKLVHSIEDALSFVDQNGFPVVLKVTTETLAHKTEHKGVFTNINSKDSLKIAFNKLMNLCKQKGSMEELLIQGFLDSKIELMIGAHRDGNSDVYTEEGRGFGHILLFGHGGIYTEIYRDITTCLVPSSTEIILKAIKKTKVFEIIDGYRGQEKYDVNLIIDTLKKVQKLVKMYPEIESLDINPLILSNNKAYCVDLKIFVKR